MEGIGAVVLRDIVFGAIEGEFASGDSIGASSDGESVFGNLLGARAIVEADLVDSRSLGFEFDDESAVGVELIRP